MAKNIMKRTLAGTLAVLTVAGAVPANTFVSDVFAKTAISASAEGSLSGEGTQDNPYLIGSLDDFNKYLTEDKYTNADGAYIKLTADFELTDYTTITKNTILDFAGHKLSGNYALKGADGVSVTLDDSVGSTDNNVIAVYNGGELIINNVKTKMLYTDITATQTTINNGTFDNIQFLYGSAYIKGGTFAAKGKVYLVSKNGKEYISGGNFYGIVSCNCDEVNITGGTFAQGVTNNKGTLNITGGTFNQPVRNYSGTVNITGGTFSNDPKKFSDVTIPNDCEVVQTGDSEWTVEKEGLSGEGTQDNPYLIGSLDDFNKYLSEDKYTNADGAYIKLTGDFALTGDTTITKNTILDFAGHTISGEYGLGVAKGVSVTVDDSQNGSGGMPWLLWNAGELTVNNGNFGNIQAMDSATQTTVKDGKFESILIFSGNADIEGGTVDSRYYAVHSVNANSIVNISGGDFNGNVFCEKGVLNITGGTFTGEAFGQNINSVLTISGGTFNCEWINYADKPVVITGGTFTGVPYDDDENKMFELRGGTFSFDPSADAYKAYITIPDDYEAVQTGDSTWTVQSAVLQGTGTKDDPYLIGSLYDFNKYLNEDKYTNADGAYIKLTSDFKSNENINITKNTFLDFAGHQIQNSDSLIPSIDVYAELTVDDSADGDVINIESLTNYSGKLTINGGSYKNVRAELFNETAPETIFNDGKIGVMQAKGMVDINGGTFTQPHYYNLIVMDETASVNISGGTFNGYVDLEVAEASISGGEFKDIFYCGNKCITIISGGTFNGKWANLNADKPAVITGGTFMGTPSYDSDNKMFELRGGTFSFDPSADEYKAHITIPNGYTSKENSNGTWTVEEKGISGEGTEQSPYIISNAKQWELFAKNVNSGVNADAFYKLSDDFDNTDTPVTVMVGTSGNPFTGTLDGNGKTLNVNIRRETAEPATAPFSHIGGGAVIKNLNVAGSVKGAKHSSGLVGYVNGNTEEERCYIENCTSSADVEAIVTSIESRHVGGIVGHAGISYLTVKNVTFSGTLKNDSTYAGGIIGWSGSCTYTLDNCLFTGKYLGEGLFHPIALKFYNEKANATVNDCYYTEDFTINSDSRYIAVRGTKVFREVPKGIKYTTVTAADGNDYYYNFDYTVKDVSYYDSVDGETKTAEEATAVSSVDTEWHDGTYVVTESFDIDNKITVNGDVKLIVPEGKGLTLNNGICIEENSTLTVYSTKSEFLDGMIAVKDVSTEPENATIYGKGTFCNNSANVGILKNEVNAVNCGKLVTRGGRLGILMDNEESSISTTTEFIDPSVEYDLTGGYTSFDPRMQLDIDYNATHDGTFWHIEARERIKLSDLEELTFYDKDLLLDIDEDCEILIHDGDITKPQEYTKGDKLLIYKNMLLNYIDTEDENLIVDFYTVDDEGFEADDSNKYTNTNHGKNDTAAYMQYTADEDKSVKWQVSSEVYDDLLIFVNDEFMFGAAEKENGFFNIKKGDDVKIVFLKDSIDGEEVYDDLASIEFVDTITPTYVERKEPTCTEDGYVDHYVDGDGNKYIKYDNDTYDAVSDEKVILKATGHDWGDVNVVFSADFSQATATRICKNDETHIETETVDTSYDITTYPTCTEKGVKTYTAEFKNPAFGTQTAIVNIAPTGHTYNARPTWTWNGHESAVATFTCIEDDNALPLTAIVTSETTEPKVGVKGKTVYTATVGFQGKKYTNTVVEWIPAITVTKIEAVAPTHFESGTKEFYAGSDDNFYILEDGEYVQLKTYSDFAKLYIAPIPHTFGDPVWKWDEDNNAKAEFTCTEDDYVETFTADVTSETIDPTYTTEGKIVYTATVEVYDKTYTDTKEVAIDKIALTHVEAVEPTTAKEGNSEYWFDEAAGKYFADAEGKNEITLEDTVIAKLPAQVKPTYQAGDGCVKLTWDAVEGAEKYAVCGYVSGNWKLIEEGAGTSYVLNGLTSGNEYKVAVIAKVNGAWERDFSNAITVSPKIEDIEFPELTVGVQNNKFVLNWTEVKGAEKYGIAVYISGKWKVQAYTDANVTTFTSPKLKTGSSYKILVCAKVNGKWDLRDINKRFVTSTIV